MEATIATAFTWANLRIYIDSVGSRCILPSATTISNINRNSMMSKTERDIKGNINKEKRLIQNEN